jgi:hypothetical protein
VCIVVGRVGATPFDLCAQKFQKSTRTSNLHDFRHIRECQHHTAIVVVVRFIRSHTVYDVLRVGVNDGRAVTIFNGLKLAIFYSFSNLKIVLT